MGLLKVLITGANGLLGRHTVEAFRGKYEVHAMVREIPDDPLDDVKYYAHDLKSEWSSDELPQGIHTIFHLAQSELFRDFPECAIDVYNVNVTSTVKLLDFARRTGVKKFVFSSTGGIYEASKGAVDEAAPVNAFGLLGNYFATKLCSEILTRNYTDYFDVVLLRIFFMYGKGQRRSMLIPRLIDNILSGNPIKITMDDGVQINPVHVSDVVNILDRLTELKGSFTFNVAGPEVLTLKQISDLIGSKTGKRPNYEFINAEGNNCIANIESLQEILYSPKAKLEDNIQELF